MQYFAINISLSNNQLASHKKKKKNSFHSLLRHNSLKKQTASMK